MSAMLCWLDARSRGAPFFIRLENLDPDRCKPEFETSILNDMAWFGLDWDKVIYQKNNSSDHNQALDLLASTGRLYPCSCSRSRIKSIGRTSPDGGFAYDNHCRSRPLPRDGWKNCPEPLRVKLPDDVVTITDECGLRISQHPLIEMGDPVVRRRDGAVAYHLASVVDDHYLGIKRLIRGRDLAPSAPVQMLLRTLLGYNQPSHLHHFLLMEKAGGKLAKLHGSIGVPEIKAHYPPEKLCGLFARWCGLLEQPNPIRPQELIPRFSWDHIRADDLTVTWEDNTLFAI
jgi:glutamyl-tRNA synthetase/glutamyl-Q tRNA(Asp) synthetase